MSNTPRAEHYKKELLLRKEVTELTDWMLDEMAQLEQQLAAAKQQTLESNEQWCKHYMEALAECERMRKGLKAVENLISESHGVTGLHLNGDEAPWDELRTGGRFESWLFDFDQALSTTAKEEPRIQWRGNSATLYDWLRDLGRQSIYDESSRTELLRTIYEHLSKVRALSTAKEKR